MCPKPSMFSRTWEEMKKFDVAYIWIGIGDVFLKDGLVYEKSSHKKLDVTHVFPFYFSFEENRFEPFIQAFQKQNCIISRPRFSLLSDKWEAHKIFHKHNIPHPQTYLVENLKSVECMFENNKSYVLKPKHGKQGEGVELLENYQSFTDVIGKGFYKHGALLQEVIQPIGRDIRAFVIGNEVVASMERFAPKGVLVTNYSKHKNAQPVFLTDAECKIAVNATRIGGLHYAGVDLMRHENGKTYVLEVNTRPAIAIEQVTGVNVALKWLNYFICQSQVFSDVLPQTQVTGLQYPCDRTE